MKITNARKNIGLPAIFGDSMKRRILSESLAYPACASHDDHVDSCSYALEFMKADKERMRRARRRAVLMTALYASLVAIALAAAGVLASVGGGA